MRVIFKESGLKRVGQKRIEVEAGQVVECDWNDLARYPTDAYEIAPEAAPAAEPEATPEGYPEPKRVKQRRGAESRSEGGEGE